MFCLFTKENKMLYLQMQLNNNVKSVGEGYIKERFNAIAIFHFIYTRLSEN